MEVKEISLLETVPHIRFWSSKVSVRNFLFPISVSYDCRLFYITSDFGSFTIEGKNYPASADTLIIMPHGYRYKTDIEKNFLMFNFDFSSDCANIPIFSPVEPKNFDSEKIVAPIRFSDTGVFENVVYIKNAQRFYPLFSDIINELNSDRFASSRSADLKFGGLLIEIARAMSFSDPDNKKRAKAIVNYIHKNLKENLSDEALGRVFHYHPNHIRRMVTEYTGIPTHKFVVKCRLAKAFELLLETNLSLKQICEAAGFQDFSHFTKSFKKMYGKNPSDCREMFIYDK